MKIDWKVLIFLSLAIASINRSMHTSISELEKSVAQIDSDNTSNESHQNDYGSTKTQASHSQTRLPAKDAEPVWKDYENLNFNSRYDISPDLAAIEKYHYGPELGPKVSTKNGWIVFKANTLTKGIHPVVIDKSTQRTHPLSHILHIKDATLDLEQELNSVGLKTYYYNKNLKLLSVEAEPHKILETYEKLNNSGLDVELEVLKDLPQLK